MEEQEAQQKIKPHVIIIPSPGIGHLTPLVEFAKQLVFNHGFLVTFLIPTTHDPLSKPQETLLNSLPESINHTFLPSVSFQEARKIETTITLTVTRSLSYIRDEVKKLVSCTSTRVVALVGDLFGPDTLDVAKEFDVKFYIFFTVSAMAVSLALSMSKIDKEYPNCEFRDLPEPVRPPGCVAVDGVDLPDPFQDRGDEAYKWFLHLCNKYKSADGFLVNSFIDFELGAFNSIMEKEPIVYPIGPLVQSGMDKKADQDECMRWLSDQPQESVLFISFGSGGTLSSEQLSELAFGLEMSEVRFLWVVRSPNEEAANATFFSAKSAKDPFDFLPKGFLERTRGVGLVVPSWAPQIEILSHGSTGGFVTHCGWNSILESVVHGVPLIAWPLYAEQKMNAVMLKDMEVALRPKCCENGLVYREEISRVVKALMEGGEGKLVRNKMDELKKAAAKVLSEDGSSTNSLREVALKWKNCRQ